MTGSRLPYYFQRQDDGPVTIASTTALLDRVSGVAGRRFPGATFLTVNLEKDWFHRPRKWYNNQRVPQPGIGFPHWSSNAKETHELNNDSTLTNMTV